MMRTFEENECLYPWLDIRKEGKISKVPHIEGEEIKSSKKHMEKKETAARV